tara:strand:+ start:66 stop:272 length:207 start_codon:yes stop_codon:yes gene_type:complete
MDVNSKLEMNMQLIKPKEAAKILLCSERTLEAWRRNQRGPSYYKLEGKILYAIEDVLIFIEKSKVKAE